MLAFTLPGTAFFFAGDELGMPGVKIPPDRINDEFEKRVPGYGMNRDPERAPMRWDSGRKRDLPQASRGCRSAPMFRSQTSRSFSKTNNQSSGSIAGCWRSDISIRRSPRASIVRCAASIRFSASSGCLTGARC